MRENDLPPEAIADPVTFTDMAVLHGLLDRLRHTEPVARVEAPDHAPFWLLTRYADVVAVETDAARFVNAPRQVMMPESHMVASRAAAGAQHGDLVKNLISLDGDEHRVFRAVSQSRFLSKALNVIRADIEALAVEFVDRLAAKDGACDFAADVAVWYPLRVIMTILGVPPQDEALMLRLTQQLLTAQDPEFNGDRQEGRTALIEMFQYFQPIMAERRAHPQEDIASAIATAQVDGRPLTDFEVFGYYLLLATAGHDTTSYSLAGGMDALLRAPAELARLRADPMLIPTAVDEMIRWSSPVRHFLRTATEDCEVGGTPIRAGEHLMMCYPSANRDEAVFTDPHAFRVDRRPNRHLAFGTGPHVCLGQHLAKMELAAFLREFLARIDHVEPAGPPRYTQSCFVGGIKALPVRFRFKEPLEAAA